MVMGYVIGSYKDSIIKIIKKITKGEENKTNGTNEIESTNMNEPTNNRKTSEEKTTNEISKGKIPPMQIREPEPEEPPKQNKNGGLKIFNTL